jgi:predicted nucleic acid-binding protein
VIILDTNVVSEPMRPNGDPAVRDWLDRQSIDVLYLTATSLAELLVGIAVLPAGQRRDGLDAALAALIARLFGPRILPFDQPAARDFAVLVGRARARGHAIGVADGQIAAIATARGFAVATSDAAPFDAAGVPVINPWVA